MDLDLAGKTALITGGSKGIGLATARVLAAEGCRLILVARDAVSLAEARSSIEGDVEIHALDLTQPGSADGLGRQFGDVDVLINNAGAIPGGTLEQLSEEVWRASWELKLFGYIALCRRYYALMRRRGGGTIINVIGVGGLLHDPRYICGATANAALMAFTQTLGSASADTNIRVNAVNPGPVATERLTRLNAQMGPGGPGGDGMPFGRAAAPEEIAAAVAFLASGRSAYTSGAIVNVDGGLSAGIWRHRQDRPH